jgi:hypothetical protein
MIFMQKEILYLGQKVLVGCDEQCNKAWGMTDRPRNQLSDNDDDFEWLSDKELPDAPANPDTSEGWEYKPTCDEEKGNKWCIRQCERCVMVDVGETLQLIDFSNRVRN